MKFKRFTACMLAGTMAVSVFLAGCGSTINADAVGATLNGEEITLGFMNFMARYQQAYSDSYYISWFGKDAWSSDLYGNGSTLEASTKESIVENIETLYLLESHMADYGVEITEEDLGTIEEAAKKFMSDNSNKALKQVGATEEYVKEMLRLNTIQYKMREAIYAEVDTEVSDEEAAQRTFSFIKMDKEAEPAESDAEEGSTKEDAGDGESSDTKKTISEAAAKEIAQAAKEDFEGAAEDAGYTVEPYSYGKDEETMDEAVITAADGLKEGEISDLITTEDAYYILRLDSEFDEEKTEAKKESIVTQRKSDHYTEVCDGYKEEAEFTLKEEEWAKVKFDKLFNVISAEDEAKTDTEDTAGSEAEAEEEAAAGDEVDAETEAEEEAAAGDDTKDDKEAEE